MPKLIEIVKTNPSLINGLISSADEFASFIKGFDVIKTLKSNIR